MTLPKRQQSLRGMTTADLPQVLLTEAACYPEPWSEQTFADCLAGATKGYRCSVLLLDEVVVGHFVFTSVVDEAELLNFCVAPSHQGQGLAKDYFDQMLFEANEMGAAKLFLEVRETNYAARGLYQSAGLSEIGVRKNYYPSADGREDAIVMALEMVA